MDVYVSRKKGAGRPAMRCVAFRSKDKKTMLMHVFGSWRRALLEDFFRRWEIVLYEEVPQA